MPKRTVLTDAELARVIGGLDASKAVAQQQAALSAQDRKLYAKLGMCPCGGSHY